MRRTIMAMLLARVCFASAMFSVHANVRENNADQLQQIKLLCDATCTPQEQLQLPEVEALLQKVMNSQCFEDFFIHQRGNIHESQGKSPEQIVGELRNQTAQVKLSMYSLPFYYYVRFWNIPCGEDNQNGESIRITHGCWSSYSPLKRAATVGHEEAHKAGFTHLEHGNTIRGNEQSVPYLVNSAFEACPKGDEK